MNSGWYTEPAVWAYGAAAVAYVWLAIRLIAHWHPGGKPAMLLLTAIATVAAAMAAVALVVEQTLSVAWLAALADFARVAATLGFLLVFLGTRRRTEGAEPVAKALPPLIGVAGVLLIGWLLVGVRPPGLFVPDTFARHFGYITALGVAVFGLVLVEQCFRRTPQTSRWHVRPMMLALAGIFGFDVVLYSDALLFQTIDVNLWTARGFAQALTVPLILATLRRRSDWSFDLALSRDVVAGSTALLLTGAYLLLVASAGFVLREFGGSWGRALESALLFAALMLFALLVMSATFRAKVRVLVAKHFFSYRYDYREEWLRLTNALTSESATHPWGACIHAIGDLVESPGGALWLRGSDQVYRQVERLDFPAIRTTFQKDDSLPSFLKRTGWVLDVSDVIAHSAGYEGLVLPPEISNARDAWLVVPLLTSDELVGFAILTTPRIRIDLDWEVLDLLKTAGRQAAGYLAYTQAMEALLEAQKFDAFHRMSTFVVHDLKNLIAQLQLLLSNAERHRDNPEFQRDMFGTLEHVAGRMQKLILQLKPEASGREPAHSVDVSAVVRRIGAQRSAGQAGLVVDAGEPLHAWAHEDLLERVISHLVQNAFDASGTNPDVRVKVERVGGMIVVEVADSGRGMSQAFIRERLFRPFQTTKETGMGIGVFECHQYVQQVGGRMEVDSVEGKGTRVRVALRGIESSGLEKAAA